jgi:hypothetical protein
MKQEEMVYEISEESMAEIMCEECDTAFRAKWELDEHNETVHGQRNDNGRRYSRYRIQ